MVGVRYMGHWDPRTDQYTKGANWMNEANTKEQITPPRTRAQFLAFLCGLQRTCAPIKLSIGHVADSHIIHDAVTIHDAPPIVLRQISAMGVHASIVEGGGLRIIFQS